MLTNSMDTDNSQFNSAETSPFLALPVEIRIQVYKEVFEVPSWQRHLGKCPLPETEVQKCVLSYKSDPPHYPPAILLIDQRGITHSRRFRHNNAMHCALSRDSLYEVLYDRAAILRVCRTIYLEAREVLYDDTLFCIVFRIMNNDHRPYSSPLRIKDIWQWHRPFLWTAPLYWTRHLDIVFEVQDPACIKKMMAHLQTLVNDLPSTDQLKSMTVSLNCEGMERCSFDKTFPHESWSRFADTISALPLGTEVRLLCGPWFSQNGKAPFEVLNRAVGGRLKVVRDRKL